MAGIPLTRTGPEDNGHYEYHWSGEFLEAHFLSDVGMKRDHNEDACLLCAPEDAELARRRGLLFAVADGMGGVSGGEFASHLALQTIMQQYFGATNNTIPRALRAAVSEASRRIFEEAESKPEYQGMGTTATTLLVMGEHAYIAHVGDSRVYLLRDGTVITQLTDDHSLVAEQVRDGYLSEEEARAHALKNLITRAVGTREAVEADLLALRLRQGDVILLCSDGLSGVVQDEVIAASMAIENLQGAARQLVGLALDGGGPDNITAVLVRITDAPPKSELEQGAIWVNLQPPGLLGKLRNLLR